MAGHRLLGCAGFALAMTLCPHAHGAGCPREDALGTSRIIAVDAAATPRAGAKALQLGDREVVLTFDDGPSRPTDGKILAALGERCVCATFFLIGKRASEHPGLVRQIAAAGHSIGHQLHDPEAQTAAMPADFLRYLRDNRYRVVHVVPGIAATAAANVRRNEKRE